MALQAYDSAADSEASTAFSRVKESLQTALEALQIMIDPTTQSTAASAFPLNEEAVNDVIWMYKARKQVDWPPFPSGKKGQVL